MTTEPADAVPDLAEVRREIDAIDDRLLALLDARFAAVARVRAAKQAVEGPGRAAFRPAREAEVLRRLTAQGGGHVPPEVILRLWRIIMGAATQMQDGLRVFASTALLGHGPAASLLANQFMRLSACADAGAAIAGAADGGLAAVWLREPFADRLGQLHVVGALGDGVPEVFLVGAASLAGPTGGDETLVSCSTAPAGANWHAEGLAALPGFLEKAPGGARLLGRYPRLHLDL